MKKTLSQAMTRCQTLQTFPATLRTFRRRRTVWSLTAAFLLSGCAVLKTQEGPNSTHVAGRMIGFYQANGAQFAWDPKDYPPGFGQKYAAAYQDKSGDWLKGENSYRLRVPANVPVADFWALTVYDVETRALIEAPQHRAEINPNVNKLKMNADGSVDLVFGPSAPPGLESNWGQTVPGRAWFTYFRWYGPTAAYYDKSRTFPDFERIN